MNGTELRETLARLGLSQVGLAKLLSVTTRSVSLWVGEGAAVPGPASAYVALLSSLPPALQQAEFLKLEKRKEESMFEGIYGFQFAGPEGAGEGALVALNGRLFGSDGGASYDGYYGPIADEPGRMQVHLKVSIPPGVSLVTGMPAQPIPYAFDLNLAINAGGETKGPVVTPTGTVNVSIRYLRPLPADLAA